MSLLEQLNKSKIKLKRTETIITHVDGSRYLEYISSGDHKKNIQTPAKYGFVIDTKPDSIPACVLENKLYLGSQDCVEISILKAYNLRNVLSIGVETPELNHSDDYKVNYKFIPCLDLPETCLKTILSECCEFISDAIDGGEKVLVHCNAGVSRSSSAVIAYLILKLNYTFAEAYDKVKSVRPCIQPNIGFMRQLKSLKVIDEY